MTPEDENLNSTAILNEIKYRMIFFQIVSIIPLGLIIHALTVQCFLHIATIYRGGSTCNDSRVLSYISVWPRKCVYFIIVQVWSLFPKSFFFFHPRRGARTVKFVSKHITGSTEGSSSECGYQCRSGIAWHKHHASSWYWRSMAFLVMQYLHGRNTTRIYCLSKNKSLLSSLK